MAFTISAPGFSPSSLVCRIISYSRGIIVNDDVIDYKILGCPKNFIDGLNTVLDL